MKFHIQNRKIGIGLIIIGLTLLIISNGIKHINSYGYEMLYRFNGESLISYYDINILWTTFSYKTIFILTILIIAFGVYLTILKDDEDIKDEISNKLIKIRNYPFKEYLRKYGKSSYDLILEINHKIDFYTLMLIMVVFVLLFITGIIIYGVWTFFYGEPFKWFLGASSTYFMVLGLIVFFGFAIWYFSKKEKKLIKKE